MPSHASLTQAPASADANALTHDRAGVVSTRKGGGQFEFSVAPPPPP